MSDAGRASAMADAATPASDRCPRCGGAFHCGAGDALPCPCAALTVPPAVQAALRQRYSGCLCLTCLAALADADKALS